MSSPLAPLRGIPHVRLTQRGSFTEEMVWGSEERNHYTVSAPGGEPLFIARERDDPVWSGYLLGARRPYLIVFSDPDREQDLFTVQSPLRWWLARATVADAATATPLGRVQGRIERFSQRFDLLGAEGQPQGALRHRRGLNYLLEDGAGPGGVSQSFFGLLAGSISERHSYRIDFPPHWDESRRALLVAAAVVIDFTIFGG